MRKIISLVLIISIIGSMFINSTFADTNQTLKDTEKMIKSYYEQSSQVIKKAVSAQVKSPNPAILNIKKSIETLLKNKVENFQAYYTIASELLKLTVGAFSDIKETDWYAEDFAAVYSYGINVKNMIIDGLPNGTFNPKGNVSKAEFIKMVVQAMNYEKVDGNTFTDIGYEKYWAKPYIETAVKEGLIDVIEEGQMYYPTIPMTREQMAVTIARALKIEPSNSTESPFADILLSDKNAGIIIKLHEEYLMKGISVGNTFVFQRQGVMTRAEAATVIARLIQYREDPTMYKARQKLKDELAQIKVFKKQSFTKDGREITDNKEFVKIRDASTGGNQLMGWLLEYVSAYTIPADKDFNKIVLVYNNAWEDERSPRSNWAFDLDILNPKDLEGYRVKVLCVNRPEINNFGDGTVRKSSQWQTIDKGFGWGAWMQNNYEKGLVTEQSRLIYELRKGEILDYKLFVDNGTKIKELNFKIKVADDKFIVEK